MIANRRKTLAELYKKRALRKRQTLGFMKVYYRDWVYSYGIGEPKKAKKMGYQLLFR